MTLKHRKYLIIILMSLSYGVFSQKVGGQIAGKVIDADSGKPIIFGPVSLMKNGKTVAVVQTDIDGNYSISIEPGDFNMEVSSIGYQNQHIEGVRLFANTLTPLNISLIRGELMEGVEIVDYKVPIIEQDFTSQGTTIINGKWYGLPIKDMNAKGAIDELNLNPSVSRLIGNLVMAQLFILKHQNLLSREFEYLMLFKTSFVLALHLHRR